MGFLPGAPVLPYGFTPLFKDMKDRRTGALEMSSNLLMGMSATVNVYNMSLCVTLCLEDGWENAK